VPIIAGNSMKQCCFKNLKYYKNKKVLMAITIFSYLKEYSMPPLVCKVRMFAACRQLCHSSTNNSYGK